MVVLAIANRLGANQAPGDWVECVTRGVGRWTAYGSGTRQYTTHIPAVRRVDWLRGFRVQPRGNGTTQTLIMTAIATVPPMTNRWKISWKPKKRGNGFGRRSA
jgi:hypothetical protein